MYALPKLSQFALFGLLVLSSLSPLCGQERPERPEKLPFEELLIQSQVYLQANEFDKAAEKLQAAVKVDPTQARGHYALANIYERQGKLELALPEYTRFLELDPNSALGFDRRGQLHFKLARPAESVADFDQAIKLDPSRSAGHWQRGISLYYAERYDDGRKQFEGYQTVDDSDVENAVWRFLCMARSTNFDTARKEILKIGDDRRVPMRQVYDLFAGTKSAADVLHAAQENNPTPNVRKTQLFYANQYLGLFAEARGDHKQALEYTRLAVAAPIEHYMADVARVHLLLRDPANKTK